MLAEEINKNLMAQPMVSSSLAMPEVPKGGALLKVCYAGACYDEGHTRRGYRPRLPGIADMQCSGIEVAGLLQDFSNDLPNSNFCVGDRVILYQDEATMDPGYVEYMAVKDTLNLIQVPDCIPMEVAAMLPGGGLTAYSAVLKAKPHVEKLMKVKSTVNVLIVGAGGLGLWTVKIAQSLIGEDCNRVRLTVCDNSIDKLLTAHDHGCYDIIHWNEEDHEQYIIERTLDTCRGGVDVIIDFVSSPRTMRRSLKVLNREGLILVGGNALTEVSINLNMLAAMQQSIVGIPKGTLQELHELVDAVAESNIIAPCYEVYPVEDANQVFEDLGRCRITGRAILRFANASTSSTMNTSSHLYNDNGNN